MNEELELRNLLKPKLEDGEAIYWIGEGKKTGLLVKKSNVYAVTDLRVIFSLRGGVRSIPLYMLKNESYIPPEVKTEEDIMNLEELYTVHFENGSVVFKDVDGVDTYEIDCDNAHEAFELINKLISEHNAI